jgi:hypothetical protein
MNAEIVFDRGCRINIDIFSRSYHLNTVYVCHSYFFFEFSFQAFLARFSEFSPPTWMFSSSSRFTENDLIFVEFVIDIDTHGCTGCNEIEFWFFITTIEFERLVDRWDVFGDEVVHSS